MVQRPFLFVVALAGLLAACESGTGPKVSALRLYAFES
jgi:hypothetical protein